MTISLAGGQGFYGDAVSSIRKPLEVGVDYLCLEALAELTLAILQKDRQKDPSTGYTKDLPAYLRTAMPYVADGRTKVVTNAGGINPSAAAAAAAAIAREMGAAHVKIAIVRGDDLLGELDRLGADGSALAHADTGQPWSELPGQPLFANAYLGAAPIAKALAMGADIVITGRVADSALFLGPLIHEFGWAADDWDRLAAGITVGHLLECSGQSTGGNFSGEWWTVPEPWNFASPIAECEADGTAVITKAPGTGGRVDFDTVRHQLLYEVHDPARYLTPDVVADFTSVRLEETAPDRVRLSEVKGLPATDTHKVLVAYPAGWSGEGRVAFGWPDAYSKAKSTAAVLRKRVEVAGIPVEDWVEEYWGVNALHPGTVGDETGDDAPEVVMRAAWRTGDRKDCARVGRELVPIGLSAPAWGLTATGRGLNSAPSQLLGIWPTLVSKSAIDRNVTVDLVQE